MLIQGGVGIATPSGWGQWSGCCRCLGGTQMSAGDVEKGRKVGFFLGGDAAGPNLLPVREGRKARRGGHTALAPRCAAAAARGGPGACGGLGGGGGEGDTAPRFRSLQPSSCPQRGCRARGAAWGPSLGAGRAASHFALSLLISHGLLHNLLVQQSVAMGTSGPAAIPGENSMASPT